MQYEEFTKMLNEQIAQMSHARQTNFALKICKELFFDYQKFFEAENWGDPDVLLDAINLSEKVIKGETDKEEVKKFLPKLKSNIPDSDNFGSELGSRASNTSAAIYETLEFIIDKNIAHINNLANYYADTAYFSINEPTILTTEAIDNHPLIIKARNFLLAETS